MKKLLIIALTILLISCTTIEVNKTNQSNYTESYLKVLKASLTEEQPVATEPITLEDYAFITRVDNTILYIEKKSFKIENKTIYSTIVKDNRLFKKEVIRIYKATDRFSNNYPDFIFENRIIACDKNQVNFLYRKSYDSDMRLKYHKIFNEDTAIIKNSFIDQMCSILNMMNLKK